MGLSFMEPRGRTGGVFALLTAALLAGCGGGLAIVGGDAGQAVQVNDTGTGIDAAAHTDAAVDRPKSDLGAVDVDAGALPDLITPDITPFDAVAPDADPLCEERCEPGTSCCDGRCVDTRANLAHCGACGQPCEPGSECLAGVCTRGCGSGQTRCGADCVDLRSSPDHCGACDTTCDRGLACVDGSCEQECPPGTTNCGGRCVDTQRDEGHCGACDATCAPDITCSNGRCQTQCMASAPTFCPGRGACVNIRTDASHCGRCDNPCPAGMSCAAGTCECPADQLLCGGACVSATCARGRGACARSGPQRCAGGMPSCEAVEGAPGVEVCNNVDDNCDGSIDEALTRPCFSATSGTPGVGVCRAGTQSCSAGAWGACSGEVGPRPETCNGVDDNCDGATDEVPSQACFTGPTQRRGVGRCRDGMTQCIGAGLRCLNEVLPLPEICNGMDDDCDGVPDNNPLPTSCPTVPNAALSGCANGQCAYTCLTGFANCDGNMLSNGCEVNTRTDVARCGSCTGACPPGALCDNGTCRSQCSGVVCDGQCVSTSNNSLHCGACGQVCTPPMGGTASCMGGTCVGGCPAGTALCGNVCVDLRRDPGHCGSCTTVCAPGQLCLDDTGSPACVCGNGTLACGGACVNPINDPLNCGGCGVRCGAGQECQTGVCRCTAGGTSLCNGACVVLGTTCTSGRGACARTGALVCGTTGPFCNATAGTPVAERCNNADDDCDGVTDNNNAVASCTPLPFQTATCVGGVCGAACFPGRGDCDGTVSTGCETDLLDNPSHCGRCGNSCGNGECLAGACVPCRTGLLRCGNQCVNVLADLLNCGVCGRRCADTEVCELGFCRDSGIQFDSGVRD